MSNRESTELVATYFHALRGESKRQRRDSFDERDAQTFAFIREWGDKVVLRCGQCQRERECSRGEILTMFYHRVVTISEAEKRLRCRQCGHRSVTVLKQPLNAPE